MNNINTMILIEVLAIIAFIILLIASAFMLITFYICDSHNCKAFKQASTKAPVGSKEYVLALLGELYNDGIWPFPYIGASVLTPLALWFIGAEITVKNFAIVFLVSFIVIYFLFSFFGHHYIKFVAGYVADYIRTSCPSNNSDNSSDRSSNIPPAGRLIYSEDEDNSICTQTPNGAVGASAETLESSNVNNTSESNGSGFKPFSEGLDVTFAAPVNVF